MGSHIKLKGAALAFGIVLSVTQLVTGAMAFSTETITPPQDNTQPPPITPFGQQLSVPGKTLEQAPNDPLAMTGKDSGTEVTIPGIGSVGKLPKLDFGLELLYGQKNPPDAPQFNSLDQHSPDDDMQIKGTLSHKF